MIFTKNSKKTEIPGSLTFKGEKKQNFTRIRLIAYNETDFIEQTIEDLKDLTTYQKKYSTVWINIDGVHDSKIIDEIGQTLEIHPLILEDIMHTGQQPKIQVDPTTLFAIFKMLSLDEESNYTDAEQFSLILKNDLLLTFQEVNNDVFEPVRDRIRNKTGRIINNNTDYLAFSLLDCLADNYSYIIEHFGTAIENLEETILKDPKPEVLKSINTFQIEMNFLRKIIRPTKEMVTRFNKTKSDIISTETHLFMSDLAETLVRVHDNVESSKSMLNDLLNVYSTHVNHKLNDIMKVLTIFSATFIPLTLIAGIYGTNFTYLPELNYKYSYFVMLGIMILLVIGMLYFFKKKRWI